AYLCRTLSSGHCPFFSAFSKWTQATAWYCIPLLSRLISKEISRVSCAFKELDGIWKNFCVVLPYSELL
uniref:hypothetical protein n=1 Tax=Dysosmobacter welbionis TaxID=2093857 RepID=UPI003FEF0872